MSTLAEPPVAEPSGPPADAIPPWRPWTAPAALFLALAGALLLGSMVYGISSAVAGDATTPVANLVATLLGDVCFVTAAVFLAAAAGRPTLRQFGLRPPRTSLWMTLLWMGVAFLATNVLGQIFLHLVGVSGEEDRTLNDLGIDRSTAMLLAVAFTVTVVAPIAEETLFRGYMFTALRNWAGVLGGALISGAMFGLVHLDPDRPAAFLLPLAIFGVALALLYWKTGSLLPCIALHSINNSLAFGSLEHWGWQIPVLLVSALGVLALLWVGLTRRAPGALSPPPVA